MRTVNCIICGKDETKLLTINDGFRLVRCKNDGLVYVNPQPAEEDSRKFYETKKYFARSSEATIGYADYLADKPAILKNTERIIREIRKFCSAGKFFDIGCAFGFALDLARKEGFDVYGNDLNSYAIEYAKTVLGLEHVHVGYADKLGYPDGSFDVVTMLGTIEHFQNPDFEVRIARRLLKLGGVLALVTVDFDSLIGKGTIRPPEHLYYFSQQTMRRFLELNGFQIAETRPRFGFNIFYFTVEDFIVRTCDYFYRLTSNSFIKKILDTVKKSLVYIVRKIGLSNQVIPGIDGQFLTIAQRKS